MLYYKKLPFIAPEKIFLKLAEGSGTIFLDSNMCHEHYGRYSFIVFDPLTTFVAGNNTFIDDFKVINDLINENYICLNHDVPPFIGGFVGYLSYDLAKKIEFINDDATIVVPDYILGLYNKIFAFDNINHICYLMVVDVKGYVIDVAFELDRLYQIYAAAEFAAEFIPENLPPLNLSANFSAHEYVNIVEQAKQFIRQGDIFEVNLAQCFCGDLPPNYPIISLYKHLAQINPAPFSAFLNFDSLKILSSSPERFLKVYDNAIEACPIKGTIKANLDKELNEGLKRQLQNSVKDRAENIMIVDLMRNDLARICTPASVEVTSLCGIESFTNVHHLVSVIKGELKDKVSVLDIIQSCFPGGSITGAPKIRATQIIAQLEQLPRGVYCGSIGYFSFNKAIDLSIVIRTIIINRRQLSYHAGGAVTLDSEAAAEYAETLLKAQKLGEAINGSYH